MTLINKLSFKALLTGTALLISTMAMPAFANDMIQNSNSQGYVGNGYGQSVTQIIESNSDARADIGSISTTKGEIYNVDADGWIQGNLQQIAVNNSTVDLAVGSVVSDEGHLVNSSAEGSVGGGNGYGHLRQDSLFDSTVSANIGSIRGTGNIFDSESIGYAQGGITQTARDNSTAILNVGSITNK